MAVGLTVSCMEQGYDGNKECEPGDWATHEKMFIALFGMQYIRLKMWLGKRVQSSSRLGGYF